MKAIYWDMETQGDEVRVPRDPGEPAGPQAAEYRAKMIEAAAEANDDAHAQVPRRRGAHRARRSVLGLRKRAISERGRARACAAPPSRTRACRRCSMRSSSSCPRPIDMPDVKGMNDRRRPGDPQGERRCAVLRAGLQDPDRPLRRQPDLLPRVLRRARLRRHRVLPTKDKKERIGRLLQMHANERTEIKEVRAGDIAAAVGLKDVITGDTLCDLEKIIMLEKMKFPDARHLGRGGAEDQGRPGEDGPRAAAPGEGRPHLPRAHRPGDRRRRSSPAWASCTWRSSSTA